MVLPLVIILITLTHLSLLVAVSEHEAVLSNLYLGLWALFLFSALSAAALIVISIPALPGMVENFHGDSYDTILSVKVLCEEGPFGQPAYFGRPYAMFGNFPMLYASLACLLDIALNDYSLSVTVLYWAIGLGIAALLWFVLLKKFDWKVRALIIAVFLADIVFGNLFPLGFRKRQQLAVLLGLGMLATESRIISGPLAFLSMLAQPFTGILLSGIKALDCMERRDYPGIAILAAALAISLPFYSGLLFAAAEEPAMPGCGLITFHQFAGPAFILAAAILVFCYGNRAKLGWLGTGTAGLASFYPVSLLAFLAMKDFAPASLTERYLYLASMPCVETILQAAAVGMVAMLYLRGAKLSRIAASILIVFSVINLAYLMSGLMNPPALDARYGALGDILVGNNISRVKSAEMVVSGYGGENRFTPQFPWFPFLGYSILEGKPIEFIDEIDLPPQMSRGGSNIPMMALPPAIYGGDADGCREAVSQLREAGAQGALVLVNYDFTAERDPAAEARFYDRGFLEGCGLGLVSGMPPGPTTMAVYRVLE